MDIEFTLLIPEFILAGVGFFVLAVDMLMPRSWDSRRNGVTATSAALGLALVFVVALVRGWDEVEPRVLYDQLILVDRYALLFKALFTATGFAVVLMSVDYVGRKMRHPGEFYAMIVFAVLGATLMAETGELLTAFISIELLSFSLYVLVGLSRGDGRSAEASTKYILLGAISSGIMLYGISLLYGALGTTVFERMSDGLAQGFDLTLVLGFVLFVAGLGFKLSMVPFHMWAPDVYEGAPTPVTALIAVMSKAAAFALALRFFAVAGVTTLDDWRMAIAVLAAATMTVGSVTALVQNNIKRLLAYSSIAQVGFVMVGIVALSIDGVNAALLHLVGYAFTNLAVFTVVIAVESRTGKEEIADYAGLAARSPLMAMVMTGALFSLAGLPIFAGFVTKFFLFSAATAEGLLWLAAIAIVNSVISLYYYLRIVRTMYMDEPEDGSPLPVPLLTKGALWLLFAGTVAVGVYPGPWVDAIDAATVALGPLS